MSLHLYNSLSNKIERFTPLAGNQVTMYNCGPTVYDYAHIGNFRSFLFADLLRRVLEMNGYHVNQIMNLTDVGHMTLDDTADGAGEDKMAAALKKHGGKKKEKAEKKDGYRDLAFTSPFQIADFFIEKFKEDYRSLNLMPPAHFPKATDHIDEMVEMINTLLDKGYAYLADDGTYYFDISQFPSYGKLSNNTLDALVEGAGGRVDKEQTRYKRNPFDFALWKRDDTHLMNWNTSLGTGFPGWHIECSAMSQKYLGKTLDIHTGGEDNKFPHHECEIAQSESCFAQKYVNYWMHTKFLLVEGEKMSKSKGNFYTVRQLIDQGYHPLAIRWSLICTNYSQTLNFTLKGLSDATKNIEKLVEFKNKIESWAQADHPIASPVDFDAAQRCQQLEDDFKTTLNQNINISGALGHLFSFLSEVNKLPHLDCQQASRCLTALAFIDQVLGVVFFYQKTPVATLGEDLQNQVETLIEARNTARNSRDFQKADEIRDQLLTLGIEIKDTKDGTTWKKQ